MEMHYFTPSTSDRHCHWRCHPTADDACKRLLDILRETVCGAFRPEPYVLNERHVGNLGEFVAMCVGKHWHAEFEPYHIFAANGFEPLTNASRPGLDLVWIFFGNTASEDVAVLQEVKTTDKADLEIAYKIKPDYEKLFDTDPSLTLKSRLSAVKTRLELEARRKDLALRVNKFICIKPNLCSSLSVLPTLVYDCATTAQTHALERMMTVRTSISALGWETRQVKSWAIAIEKLYEKLTKLATGAY
jgi:hypothetical protein